MDAEERVEAAREARLEVAAELRRVGGPAGDDEEHEPVRTLAARLDRDGRHDSTDLTTGRALDPLFEATVEAAEEAVLNSMFGAPTTVGRDGNTSESLHDDRVLALLEGRV